MTRTKTTAESLDQIALLEDIQSNVEGFIAKYRVDRSAANLLAHDLKRDGVTPQEFRVETTCEIEDTYKPSLKVVRNLIVSTEGTESVLEIEAIQIRLESRDVRTSGYDWHKKVTRSKFDSPFGGSVIDFEEPTEWDSKDYRIAVYDLVWNPRTGRRDGLEKIKTFAAKEPNKFRVLEAGEKALKWLELWTISEGGFIGRSSVQGLRHVHVDEYHECEASSRLAHELKTVPQHRIVVGKGVEKFDSKKDANDLIAKVTSSTNPTWENLRSYSYDVTMLIDDLYYVIVASKDGIPHGFLGK